jgi:dethiobiotin synthase
MIDSLYIAGTGRGVGKTTIGRALAAALARRDMRLAVMKPVQTGAPLLVPAGGEFQVGGIEGDVGPEELEALARLARVAGPPPAPLSGQTPRESLAAFDAEALAEAASATPIDSDLTSPYRYAPPLEPAVAARLLDEEIDLEHIADCFGALSTDADLVLVEDDAGLMAPLNPTACNVDLVRLLGAPVLLVAPSKPGVLNDVLLSAEVLRARELTLAGIVLDRLEASPRPEEAANPYQIELFYPNSVRGVMPFLEPADLAELDTLARRAEMHIDLDGLLHCEPPGSS